MRDVVLSSFHRGRNGNSERLLDLPKDKQLIHTDYGTQSQTGWTPKSTLGLQLGVTPYWSISFPWAICLQQKPVPVPSELGAAGQRQVLLLLFAGSSFPQAPPRRAITDVRQAPPPTVPNASHTWSPLLLQTALTGSGTTFVSHVQGN